MRRLLKNSLFFSIAIGVTLVHVGMLFLAYYGFGSSPIQRVTPKRIAVQTITLLPTPPSSVVTSPKTIAPKEAHKKTPLISPETESQIPSKKKPQPKESKELAVTPKAKEKPIEPQQKNGSKLEKKPKLTAPHTATTPVLKKEPRTSHVAVENAAKKESLLQAARESIAKIQLKNDKVKATSQDTSSTFSLGKINSLKIDQIDQGTTSAKEVQYHEELAYFLRKNLRLIEPGDVKIKLTLNRLGKVAQLTITYAESRLNRELIEKSVPNLSFPSWQDRFPNQQTYTCSITLSHEALSL